MNSVIWHKVQELEYPLHTNSSNNLFVVISNRDHSIKPERVVQMLKEDGLDITIEQADLILDFLYKLADIALSQYYQK